MTAKPRPRVPHWHHVDTTAALGETMDLVTADHIRQRLELQPHPEGGWYAETFRSDMDIDVVADGRRRQASTAIYFLLERGDFSAWHDVQSDEVWHHYAGAPLELHTLGPSGHAQIQLSSDLASGQRPQAVVPAGVLQAARTSGEWTLVGCTVAPGFDFSDFSMPTRDALLARYPNCADAVRTFTRHGPS